MSFEKYLFNTFINLKFRTDLMLKLCEPQALYFRNQNLRFNFNNINTKSIEVIFKVIRLNNFFLTEKLNLIENIFILLDNFKLTRSKLCIDFKSWHVLSPLCFLIKFFFRLNRQHGLKMHAFTKVLSNFTALNCMQFNAVDLESLKLIDKHLDYYGWTNSLIIQIGVRDPFKTNKNKKQLRKIIPNSIYFKQLYLNFFITLLFFRIELSDQNQNFEINLM